MEKEMYLVSVVNKEAGITTLWREQILKLSWIDWQIWACPVFDDYKKALKYAGWNKEVIEILTILK